MKIDQEKVKEMKVLMRVLSTQGRVLTLKGQASLKELSSYFLYVAVASSFTSIET